MANEQFRSTTDDEILDAWEAINDAIEKLRIAQQACLIASRAARASKLHASTGIAAYWKSSSLAMGFIVDYFFTKLMK